MSSSATSRLGYAETDSGELTLLRPANAAMSERAERAEPTMAASCSLIAQAVVVLPEQASSHLRVQRVNVAVTPSCRSRVVQWIDWWPNPYVKAEWWVWMIFIGISEAGHSPRPSSVQAA